MSADLLARNAHISDAEILQDIADTEREIATMQREAEGFAFFNDRWSDMRRQARISGIAEREQFIAKLRELLDARAKP